MSHLPAESDQLDEPHDCELNLSTPRAKGTSVAGHPGCVRRDVPSGATSSFGAWTDLGRDEIRRANLDGSGVEVIATALSHGLQNPIGIAVDTIAQQVYCTDTTTDKITRADLDGSNPTDFITTGLSFPRALAIVPGGDPPVYAPTLTAPVVAVFVLLLAATGCAVLARRARADGPGAA